MLGAIIGQVGFVVAIFVIAGLLNIRKCDAQSVCLSYGGGPVESNHFQGTFGPSSGTRLNGAFDKWFTYPVSVRAYSVSSAAGEAGEKGVSAGGEEQRSDAITSIPATTRDRINVDWQVTVYFKLNTNLLRPFHEQLGLRYKAYDDRGWELMLRQTFRKQLETLAGEGHPPLPGHQRVGGRGHVARCRASCRLDAQGAGEHGARRTVLLRAAVSAWEGSVP